MISNDEQVEIFDFYSATSYNSGLHVLNYDNNDTTPPEGFLLVIKANLTRIRI